MNLNKNQLMLIIVSSLGYFVDIYDIVLFNIIKESSLTELGLWSKEAEIELFNYQMFAMLLGGVFWGIIGDKYGRIKVLFGSILMYSIANIGNAYVWDMESYRWMRFLAGFGLAGELGAGVTLILETMDRQNRGWGTLIMISFGVLGAIAAFFVGNIGWKMAYIIGGVLGLGLLLLRMSTFESNMYRNMKTVTNRGNLMIIFRNKALTIKYIACILMGLPIWFTVAVMIALSKSYFGELLDIEGIVVGKAVMYCYIGLAVGDVLSGYLSQLFEHRLKVVKYFLVANMILLIYYFYFMRGISAEMFYVVCFFLGVVIGYWAVFVTISAEQFGTNIRSTVATTVPNWVRGSVTPITLMFSWLASTLGAIYAGTIIGMVCIAVAFWSVMYLEDTFGKDLDYLD